MIVFVRGRVLGEPEVPVWSLVETKIKVGGTADVEHRRLIIQHIYDLVSDGGLLEQQKIGKGEHEKL